MIPGRFKCAIINIMLKINSTEFGSITIDNVKYTQVLIICEKVIERDYDNLKKLFGTSHEIGDWELAELLLGNPEIILIGTGQDAMLVVDEMIISEIRQKGIELIIEKTPKIIDIYNNLTYKKVNCLIHTTC
jgi:hypothetical protein